ncbi:MAG: hypothetical protein U0165_11425 [Polyangiaceae bacterium]
MTDLERAQLLLVCAPDLYAERKQKSDTQAARDVWTDGPMFTVEPYFYEIHQIPFGVSLTSRPSALRAGLRFHRLDAANRLVYAKFYDSPSQFDEELVHYDSPIGESIRYTNGPLHRALRADVFRYGEQIQRMTSVNAFGGIFVQEYTYEARLLSRMVRQGQDEQGRKINQYYLFEHDQDNELSKIELIDDGAPARVVFRQPDVHGMFARYRKEILLELRDLIVKHLRTLHGLSEVCALVINYCASSITRFLPPTLSLLDARQRDKLRLAFGSEESASYANWNPAEWNNAQFLTLPESLRRKVELANRDIWKSKRFDEVYPFMVELASELSKIDLPIPKAEDFVCYCTTEDEGLGTTHLCDQIDAKTLSRLCARGLLIRPR